MGHPRNQLSRSSRRSRVQGSYEVAVFRRSASDLSGDTVSGGTFNASGTLTAAPTDWELTVADAAGTDPLWESITTYNPASPPAAGAIQWSVPFQAGSQGPTGPRGIGVFSGTAAPSANVPADAPIGSFYIRTGTGSRIVFGPRVATTTTPDNNFGWGDGVQLVGEDGDDGNTVRSGAGAPAESLGVNNDFYIDTTNNDIYGPKDTTNAPNSWGSGTGLVGPQGERGLSVLSGTAAPLADVPANAPIGSFYLQTIDASGNTPAGRLLFGPRVATAVSPDPDNNFGWGTGVELVGSAATSIDHFTVQTANTGMVPIVAGALTLTADGRLFGNITSASQDLDLDPTVTNDITLFREIDLGEDNIDSFTSITVGTDSVDASTSTTFELTGGDGINVSAAASEITISSGLEIRETNDPQSPIMDVSAIRFEGSGVDIRRGITGEAVINITGGTAPVDNRRFTGVSFTQTGFDPALAQGAAQSYTITASWTNPTGATGEATLSSTGQASVNLVNGVATSEITVASNVTWTLTLVDTEAGTTIPTVTRTLVLNHIAPPRTLNNLFLGITTAADAAALAAGGLPVELNTQPDNVDHGFRDTGSPRPVNMILNATSSGTVSGVSYTWFVYDRDVSLVSVQEGGVGIALEPEVDVVITTPSARAGDYSARRVTQSVIDNGFDGLTYTNLIFT